MTYCALSDMFCSAQFFVLYSLLVHCLICSKFSSFVLSNIFLHCQTYSVFSEFVFELSGFGLSEKFFALSVSDL